MSGSAISAASRHGSFDAAPDHQHEQRPSASTSGRPHSDPSPNTEPVAAAAASTMYAGVASRLSRLSLPCRRRSRGTRCRRARRARRAPPAAPAVRPPEDLDRDRRADRDAERRRRQRRPPAAPTRRCRRAGRRGRGTAARRCPPPASRGSPPGTATARPATPARSTAISDGDAERQHVADPAPRVDEQQHEHDQVHDQPGDPVRRVGSIPAASRTSSCRSAPGRPRGARCAA